MRLTFLEENLDSLETRGLKRDLRNAEGAQARELIIDQKKVLNFCSNNYLGLANDLRLKKSAVNCMRHEGFGSGASRLVCGNMNSHRMLEQRISAFKQTESCIVFSTGYMANLGIISSLFNRDDVIFSDRLNHASIIDGILLSGACFKRYHHCDMDHLETCLKNTKCLGKRGIITDSVFSMDGDIAPLRQIVTLADRYEALVMVDEAHALGVFGKKGRGCVEHFNLQDKIDVQMGTLSKAAGSFGAYACGTKNLISFLINQARSFIYTTGMPPAICAASSQAIEIIEKEPLLRQRLWDNTAYLKGEIEKIGLDTMHSESPIIPILIKDSKLAVEFSQRLFQEGVFVQAIRPPTVPANTARLRLTVMATHTKQDMDFALQRIGEIAKKLCLR